jgi:hypothetical protein
MSVNYRPGDPWSLQFSTLNAQGAATNADATPTVTVYRDGTNDTANWALGALTNPAVGRYRVTGSVPVAATHGQLIEVEVAATIGGVAAKAFVERFRVDASGFDGATRCIVTGTVATGATVTSIPTTGLNIPVLDLDQFKGRILLFPVTTTTAALRGQATNITAVAADGTLTVSALSRAPVAGDTFILQ